MIYFDSYFCRTVAESVERLVIDPEAMGSSSEHSEPNSDFHIRNRYLSRIGAPVSFKIGEIDIFA